MNKAELLHEKLEIMRACVNALLGNAEWLLQAADALAVKTVFIRRTVLEQLNVSLNNLGMEECVDVEGAMTALIEFSEKLGGKNDY